MILRTAHKEFIEMIRDGRVRWGGAIVFALLITSLLIGWKHYRDVSREHQAAQKETREQWLNQGVKNPHSAAHYGYYAFKPKTLPSLLDRGVEPYTGVAVWLEAHKQNDFKYRPAADSTSVQRFGELTVSLVMQLLIPLLIILLAFSSFAGEREQGTLRQVLSIGVKKTHLIAGKALGITSVLALLLIPSAIIGSTALAFITENGAMTAGGGRISMMTLGYLIYFGIFLAISLAVSAVSDASRTALVVLLGFWMFNCLLAPRAAVDVAKKFYPTPSAFEFSSKIQHEMRNGVDGHNPADQRAEQLKQKILKRYSVSRMEDLPVGFSGIALQEGEEYGYKVYDKYYGNLWDTFSKQNRLNQIAGIFAPMLAVRSLSMGFAGTDFDHHRDFAMKAESYRRYFIKNMNEDIIQHGRNDDKPYLKGPALWNTVKDFDYVAPETGWVLGKQKLAIAILVLWMIVASIAAVVVVGKLRV